MKNKHSEHCYRTPKKHCLCEKTKKYSSIKSIGWMSSLINCTLESILASFTLPLGKPASSIWFSITHCIPRVSGSKFQGWFPVSVKPFYWHPRVKWSLCSGICLGQLTTVFVDTRLWQTKHPRKRFKNFRQSVAWHPKNGCGGEYLVFQSRVSTKTVVSDRKLP